ncbi:hypothetical protein BA065_00720 [Nanoarchaeota archaeon NZ13-N]|nr:MAG: hypothetical protein BA065_00720 [Nanoarchaeota archaeon NZ13-N]
MAVGKTVYRRGRRKSEGEIPSNPTRNREPGIDEDEGAMSRGNLGQPWRDPGIMRMGSQG